MEDHAKAFSTCLSITRALRALVSSVLPSAWLNADSCKVYVDKGSSILLAMCMISFIFTGCSSNNTSPKNSTATKQSVEAGDYISPGTNSFSEDEPNKLNENNLKVNKQKQYRNAYTKFCAKLDEKGKGADFGIIFTREGESDYVYVYLDNKAHKFASNKVKFNVFKLENGEYRYYSSVSSNINPSWTYLYHPLQFNDPGEYEVDSYNSSGVLISTGRFLLQ